MSKLKSIKCEYFKTFSRILYSILTFTRHSKPKRGHKLGSASATWQKIKLATSTGVEGTDDNLTDAANDINFMMDTGYNGEIFIVRPQEGLVELWDWVPPSQAKKNTKLPVGDTLYIQDQNAIGSFHAAGSLISKDQKSIEAFKVLQVDGVYLLLLVTKQVTATLEVHEFFSKRSTLLIQSHDLPAFMTAGDDSTEVLLLLKIGKDFLVISNNKGQLYILKRKKKLFILPNTDLGCNNIRKSACVPLMEDFEGLSTISDDELTLQTSKFDGKPVFDIVGNWLVYSPTRKEYRYLNAINNSNGKIKGKSKQRESGLLDEDSSRDISTKSRSIFTQVKLPPPGPLLSGVISALSNSALDGLFKISEVSSNRLKHYMSKDKDKAKADRELKDDLPEDSKDLVHSLNSLGKIVGRILYSTASSTANTIQKKSMALKPNDNQLIKIIDLNNDKTLAVFKPPGGVSNLSLSPYDLQLVQANTRGDNFFMWDLCKLPNEISLIGKFTRGKTSAIIKDIFWFINNYGNSSIIKGNNMGFGCITKSSGSVHWFNINYLSGDFMNNRPNTLMKDTVSETPSKMLDHFLDSWVLSSLHAEKFIVLPSLANNIDNDYGQDHTPNMDQLAVIDSKQQIKLISPLNGSHLFKYKLPVDCVSPSMMRERRIGLYNSPATNNRNHKSQPVIPLSQTEIETCAPYLNLIDNKNVSFATYKFHSHGTKKQNFIDFLNDFSEDFPINDINIGGKGNPSEINLLNRFSNGLIIDQDSDLVIGDLQNHDYDKGNLL